VAGEDAGVAVGGGACFDVAVGSGVWVGVLACGEAEVAVGCGAWLGSAVGSGVLVNVAMGAGVGVGSAVIREVVVAPGVVILMVVGDGEHAPRLTSTNRRIQYV
jgi:hypothetical protein